eukprot:Nitzschia sp. Nitz4//scaffold162_size51285//27330//28991//NITZ4_006971-RA/size51285-processed-gene-0.34-mRNA-1//1//CDS//3329537979//5366//frame0
MFTKTEPLMEQSSSSPIASTALPKVYPYVRGKPIYHGNQEALAWALDGIARAVQFIGAGAFLGTALIRIAKEAAGCPTEPPEGESVVPECNEKVYGIKPSSLLTTYTMIVGVASACLLPLMGAIVDYTPYRLRIGQISSVLFTVLIIPTIFLNENNFFGVALVQVVLSFTGWAQTAISYAYLPELTTDVELLSDYTKSFTICNFGSMVIYLGINIGLVQVLGKSDDDLFTNQLAMSIALGTNIVLLGYSWGFLFGHRPRMHELPPDRSLWTAGFVQLYNTSNHIFQNYRSLKWFYISISMCDGGLQALATIAITYMADQLLFSAQESGIAIGSMLLGSVPGAALANWVTKRMGPIASSMSAIVLLIIATALFALLIKGPGQTLETYILAFVWGIGTGWKWTCDRLVASSIIPNGQDTELMGVFLFSGQCLSWVPPLLYTTINEMGVSQRIGVATLDIFFVLALMACWMMGSYETARMQVQRSDRPPLLEDGENGVTRKDTIMVPEANQEEDNVSDEQVAAAP